MDFRDDYEYDEMDSRYSGNRNLYCDLCMRRCRGMYHVVERGDTLYSIGKRYHVSVSDLMRANPYVNVYNLRIGEELCIPVRPQPGMGNAMPPMQQPGMGNTMPPMQQPGMNRPPMSPMPQPRMNDGMSRMPRMSDNMSQMPHMNDSMDMSDMRNDGMMSQEEVEAEETTSLKMNENQFSESDTIKEVLAKTGLSMSDFVRFLAEKID